MQAFRLSPRLLNDRAAQELPPAAFRAAVYDALAGRGGPLHSFIRPCSARPSAAEWRALRDSVFARDNYTCKYCGERGGRLECDHITPVSRGGSNDRSNLATACRPCNRAKRDKTPEEWQP